ncbi:MAG: N-acetyltransferase [Cyclobacteriaceae bacterium]|nr:MAG: N-acetyltransferase [Cyclobacteriaceae bacterium]
MDVVISIADDSHLKYTQQISTMMAEAAKARGTGIAERTPDYLSEKIKQGKAVIALSGQQLAGFCYIESWGHEQYVANSGLIVHPDFRRTGLAKKIKKKIFDLSRLKFPNAKIFGITTSLAVMKINSELGYKPVTFSELTTDESFWKGCLSCQNYDILQRTNKSHCLCTGMLYHPEKTKEGNGNGKRWERFKNFLKRNAPKKFNNEK